MKAAVSGSHGFLGSHLMERLKGLNHIAVPIERRLLHDPYALRRFFIREKPDWIFHLAAYGNMHDQKNEQEMFMANVMGTWNVLKAAQEIPYKKFVYVSSSSVILPKQTMYSTTKAMAEKPCEYYNVAIIRPYSITGVGEQKEHLIPTLINAAFTGKSIPFVSSPVHDFIDVDDVVSVLLKAEKGIYHVGSGEGHSNEVVKRLVEMITGRKIKTKRVKSLRSYDNDSWISPQDHSTKGLAVIIDEMVNAYE